MPKGTETKYAMNGDLAVAYRTFGSGQNNLLMVGNWFTNVEALPDVPPVAEWIDRISSMGRVIMFDQPGSGASDPVTLDALPSLEQWTDSIRAVLDALGVERTVLLSLDGSFYAAALFAATHPARTEALISLGGYARVRKSDDYPIGLSDEMIETVIEMFASQWGTAQVQHQINPDMYWSEEIRSSWARAERLACTPNVCRRMLQLTMDLDVTDVLPLIQVPTLAVQHEGNPLVGRGGRYLAEHIQGAKSVDLPGRNFYPFGEDAVEEIREFLTGERHALADEDRVLATVLFTDIVDSTKRASELGDRNWRALLDAHDAVVRSQLTRFRGREVKTVGDGFLATFDGPQRAIKCAVAIRDAVQPLDLNVRAGLHTGECELRGEDIGGIAVHIGARVSALAGAGEVWVSSTVRDLVVGSGLNFEERGAHELKGVPGEWHLYAVAS